MYFSFLANSDLDDKTLSLVARSSDQFLQTSATSFWCEAQALAVDLPAGTLYQSERNWQELPPKLIVFDMDSTLIRAECIDEMARVYGVYDQVSATTAAAMRGELDFNQSLRARLALLKGMPEQQVHQVYDAIEYQWGVDQLFTKLRELKIKTAILSGGFTWFAERVAKRLGIDSIRANQLEIADGCLTGDVVGDIVNADIKASSLIELADRYDIAIEDTIAVGDGANDLKMMSAAGLGVAIHGKPAVVAQADTAINEGGIDRLLHLLGYVTD